jgi:hypothetical protein
MMAKLDRIWRHGLVTQAVKVRVRRIGVDLNPYCLIREGTKLDGMRRPNRMDQYRTTLLAFQDLSALVDVRAEYTNEKYHNRLAARGRSTDS